MAWDTQLLSVAHGSSLRVTMRGHGVGHTATKRGTRQLFACNHAWKCVATHEFARGPTLAEIVYEILKST